MNFKVISTILAFLSFDLLALSSPLNNKENSTDAVDIFSNNVDNLQTISKKDHLMDEAEITEISSEEETIEAENIEEILEIDSSDEDDNVCNTPECIEVSNKIINDMDTSVDPCDDFYQFTCGNFMKREKDEFKSNSNTDYDNIYKDLIKILEGDYQPDKTLSKKEQEYDEIVFNKLKGFYNSCKYNYNNNGSKPLFNLLNKLKISEKKDKYHDPNELAKTLAELEQIKYINFRNFNNPTPYPHLFIFNYGGDSSELSISLSEAFSLTLYYEKDELVDYLSKIYDGSDRDVNKMVDLIIEFENKLFNSDDEEDEETTDNLLFDYENIDLEQMFLSSYEIISVKTLNEMYPNINWKLYIEEVFKSVDINDVITDETEVYLQNKKYFEKLNRILAEIDGETLSYYFELYIITNYQTYLPDNLQQNDPYTEEGRTLFCHKETEYIMNTALLRYYVISNFSQDKKQYAEKIIEYIKQSMINRIQKMEWLDDETIEYAYKKVAAMTEIVGYQDSFLDPEYI